MASLQQQINWCTRVQWLLVAGILAMVLAFYVFGYRPAQRRLDTVQMQIQSRARELDQNQNRARYLPILAREVQKLESKVAVYDRQFPKQPQLGEFIRDLTQISQQASLREWKYQPGAPKRGESYFELPIQMHFEGDFLSVVSFLREMEQLQRLTWVFKLGVKSKESTSGAVEVDMAMNVYFSEG